MDKPNLPVVFSKKDIASNEHAASIYIKLKNIEAMCESIKDMLKQYADDHGGIQLDDQKVYKRCEENNRSISVDANTEKILSEHLGARADNVVDKKISLTNIATVVRLVYGPGKTGAEAERKLLNALDANGCIRQSKRQVYKIVKGAEQ